ncbi:MAG: LamG-like jellyroll fold domain-containing protein, partial [Planctomycetota bacterium]
MCRRMIYLILLVALFAGSAQAQFITSIVHRNGNAPEMPEIAPNPLAEDELTFVDRTHEYNDIPESILGAQYVKLANDDKGISAYELDLTFAINSTLFVFVDNRMGSSGGGKDVDPDISGMGWLNDMGFVDTGEDIGIDESGDGDIDQYFSIFSLSVTAGTVTIFGNTEGHGGNMLGAAALGPKLMAYNPDPQDQALVTETWVSMGWATGDTADSHDVYLSDNFDDVNDGTADAFQTNLASGSEFYAAGFSGYPYPDGLVPGTTYYWRIDEIEADGTTIYKGNVWSFWIPPKRAYEPNPGDGAKFVDLDLELSWTAGFEAKLHTVYFGNNFDDVNDATAGPTQTTTTFSPGVLETDTAYYWRVDEFVDITTTHKGDVWSFKTMPDIPITDPNFVGWWKFEAGAGTTVLDFSGHENHGTLFGPEWVTLGRHGPGLNFSPGDYVAIRNLSYSSTDLTEVTVCAWIRTSSGSDQFIISYDRNEYWRLEINGSGAGQGQVGWDVMTSSGQVDYGSATRVDDGLWHHVCGVFDNGQCTIYIDGSPEPSATGGSTFGSGDTRFGFIGANSEASGFNGNRGNGSPITGDIDDVRIYDKSLTQQEIVLVMRGDPLLAWQPGPANGSISDIDDAIPISWMSGDMALEHDVYFDTDKDAVDAADASDATGVYRGRQSGTAFTPTEPVEWGTGPYYWRIDEINNDGTISKGTVWSFTVADFTLIDDFEDYNIGDNEIWFSWNDGLGAGTPGIDPYVPGNGTGSMVGDDTTGSYTEENIVHGGGKSMPYWYDNNKQGSAMYSEAVLTLSDIRDWTKNDVAELSIWFRGNPASVGSFVESPAGTYTMTAAGADIWAESDQFHYAFKTLTGSGSITAKVESLENTDPFAKAGLMVRDTLSADSTNVALLLTPENGVRFQYRSSIGAVTEREFESDLVAPLWLKLE